MQEVFQITMLPAREGDCFWIKYGQSDNLNHILIDGGRQIAYDFLLPYLAELSEADQAIELAVLTHVDADHIEGILKLVAEKPTGFVFKDFWFNGFHHLDKERFQMLTDQEDFGAVQGENLTKALVENKWPWNKKFDKKSIVVHDPDNPPVVELDGGMKITIISPDWKKLNKMKSRWEKEVKAAGMVPGVIPEEEILADNEESFGALTIREIDELADKEFQKDTSPANGSSIAFIAEYGDRKILFAGDAHAEVIVKYLEPLIGEDGEKFHLDAFKVSHHGSRKTLSNDVLRKISCKNYLVSTNGSRHGHPDREAMARILKHGGDEKKIYFNYMSSSTEIWDSERLKNKFNYKTCYPSTEEEGIMTIDLI